MKKRGIIIFLVLLMSMMLTACGKTKVDLNKYITISVDGYNTVGTADYSFDYSAFRDDYANVIEFPEEDMMMQMGWSHYDAAFDKLLDFVVPKLDKDEGLSNGDTIILSWECDDAVAEEYFNCILKYEDIEYKVKDLEDAELFNPFEYIELEYRGRDGSGVVSIIEDEEQKVEMQFVEFQSDKYDELKNGETITITAEYRNGMRDFTDRFGSVFSKSEQEYIVEGLPKYATEITEISNDLDSKMKKQGEDVFKSYVANVWAKPENLYSVNCIGNYFLKLKEGASGRYGNQMFYVYKISALNPKPEQMVEFYYYVGFNNIMILPDGTCSVDLNEMIVPERGYSSKEKFRIGTFEYIGYTNLESLFNHCVVTKIDSYEYVSTVIEE